ncbi:MAG: hypothetical protein ACRD1B_08545, partial [Thermoanaerobaculia bacterium]
MRSATLPSPKALIVLPPRFPPQEAKGLFVDAATRADGYQLDEPPWAEAVNDPESAEPEAPEPGELIAELLPRGRVHTDHVQCRANLTLEFGMEASDQFPEVGRDAETKGGLHGVLVARNQLLQGVDPP